MFGCLLATLSIEWAAEERIHTMLLYLPIP